MKPIQGPTRALIFIASLAGAAIVEQNACRGADAAAQGRDLYAHLCSQCHGIDMVTPGTVVPDLREFPHDAKSRFVDTVTNGKNNRMPPWGDRLTPEQIDEIWAYLKRGGKS